VPIDDATCNASDYKSYGFLQVLKDTDHINSCKPVNKNDPSYAETLAFLEKNMKLRGRKAES
jgi:hypothetical protein